MDSDGKALVLFSGGQDSATCLAWALSRFASVETVGFEYGQRHAVELECRTRFRERVVEIDLNAKEREMFKKSVDAVRGLMDASKKILAKAGAGKGGSAKK